MSGVESIASTQMHRSKAQELFNYYDEKYIQKWILHDEAVDLMVLKVQKIVMEDHFAKLYGPRVIAHQNIASSNTKDDSTKDAISVEEDTSLILQKAFSSHPYSVYKTKQVQRIDSDSQEDLQKCLKEEERKACMIWKNAFSKARPPCTPGKRLSNEENDGLKKDHEKVSDDEKRKTIFDVYSEVRKRPSVVQERRVDLNPPNTNTSNLNPTT